MTFSTGGSVAQGDFDGVEAVGLATSVGLSVWGLRTRPPLFFSPPDPILKTVAFGPTELRGLARVVFGFSASTSFSVIDEAVLLSSRGVGGTSTGAKLVLVPSVHSMVSGAQSSSSSSMSAHFASLPSPSSCNLDAREMPYC